jgi:ribonuclease-3
MISWFGKRRSPEHRSLYNLVFTSFGVKPKQFDYYQLALTHSSAGIKDERGGRLSNERLEFLGDAIIDAVLADYLYRKFPDLSEGELTKMKSKIVSRKSLNTLGDRLQLDQYLKRNLGKQELHRSMLGNAFEALIGAMYLEKGYPIVYKALLGFFVRNRIDELVHEEIDHKSKLHEWCQKERKTLEFAVLEEEQLNGVSSFVVEVRVDGEKLGKGKAKSKKHAEQEAARKACNKIFGEE